MSALWGVSFDATPISGVIVEFLKLARIFRTHGYTIDLDLGYDIKIGKGAFFRPYTDESRNLPPWVRLTRPDGVDRIAGYDAAQVSDILRAVGHGKLNPGLHCRVDATAARLSDRLLAAWERRGVTRVIVENGTLPENIAYTRALYRAIEAYGRRHRLGRFVLWRDHDLMWQSEPSTHKYGRFPYVCTPRPVDSPYVHHAVLHDEARRRMREWAPDLTDVVVLPNTFASDRAATGAGDRAFRRDFGIPHDAPIIARCTRIIRQKRIDRDIHLLAALAPRTDAYLFVAGDPAEDPDAFAELKALAGDLGVADRVVFGGRLTPLDARSGTGGYSVRDLLAHATVASFLTSYDYESYGNPIGEAIAAGVPYIASRYELYDTVYGRWGFRAPLLDIREHDLPTAAFIDEVAELLTDERRRTETADINQRIGRRVFDIHQAERLLRDLALVP